MLTLALALALAQTPQHRLFQQPNLPAGPSLAFFEFAPASGAGLPTAAGCYSPSSVTGAKGEPLTFARTSVAEVYSNDGQTLTQCSAGQVRITSGTATSDWMGLWTDPPATNMLVYAGPADLSQAAWVKTNMNCVKNAVGLRGTANTASTCTATAPNATVCQTITIAAATRTSSWHLKAGTITGVVTTSRNASTYTSDISSLLSTSKWRRVVPEDTPGCAGGNCIPRPGDWDVDGGLNGMTSSVLNPQICLKLAASGDSILVDFVQDEAGDQATAPIATDNTVKARTAESAAFTHASASIYSASAMVQMVGAQPVRPLFDTDGTGAGYANRSDMLENTGRVHYCVQTLASSSLNSASIPWYVPSGAATTSVALDCTYGPGATDLYAYVGGMAGQYRDGWTPPPTTTTYVGSGVGGLNPISGVVKAVRLGTDQSSGRWKGWPTGTVAIAWVGDSIVYGQGSPSYRPPEQMGRNIGKYVQNAGISGNTAGQCYTNWKNNIRGKGYTTVIVMCGVNDRAQPAATTFSFLQQIYDEALADGLRVIAVGIAPWANYVSWTAAAQVQVDALNGLIQSYAAAHSFDYVSTSSLGEAVTDGGTGPALKAVYDSGDGIHPNAYGSAALWRLVAAVNP